LGESWFEASPGKKFTRVHLNRKKNLGVEVHACHASYGGKHKWEDSGSGWSGQKVRPYPKTTRAKRAGGVAQAELLLRKCEALSSNP
jgi:hypothetical protein